MTTKIPDSVSTGPIANANNLPLVDELSERALEKGVNLAQVIGKFVNEGQLITDLYLKVEKDSNVKSHAKIDQLQVEEKKLKTVSTFLTELETHLSNPDAKVINMADKSSLVEEMNKLLDHKLLTKTEWTRAEAETIRTALTRHSQIIMQQVAQASSEVNRMIENGTELLQIARKILEMYQQRNTTFTRNQRGG